MEIFQPLGVSDVNSSITSGSFRKGAWPRWRAPILSLFAGGGQSIGGSSAQTFAPRYQAPNARVEALPIGRCVSTDEEGVGYHPALAFTPRNPEARPPIRHVTSSWRSY